MGSRLANTAALLLFFYLCIVHVKACSNVVTKELLYAIRQVETGGESNPAEAIGDGGASLGPYQISKAYWTDAVQQDSSLESKGYEGVKEVDYAEKVVKAYMAKYATESRLGRCPTEEDIARIHNGGPNGYKKDSTLSYWEDVKEYLV